MCQFNSRLSKLNIGMSNEIPENFCMAPWIHAMHDTTNARRICCIGLETQSKDLAVLDDFRNSDEVKNIRKQMMTGTLPYECKSCDNSIHSQKFVYLYKDFFNNSYKRYYDEAISKTSEDGHTTMDVKSFDYRFGNICNYKCRHCHPDCSSQIEHEEKKNNFISIKKPSFITDADLVLRYQQLEEEILTSARDGTLEELQWIGGESLFVEAHWRIMKYIVENGDPSKVKVTYITNLSILEFKGIHLLDLLEDFREVMIHASIESGGLAAEYIRDGLDWNTWKTNFKQIHDAWKYKKSRIAGGITLNTLSLLGLREYLDFLCQENASLASVNLHNKSNPNNLHLDINSLGSYKTQWLKEYRSLVEEYKDRLMTYNYDNLISAAVILESQQALDLNSDDIFLLKDSLIYTHKIDKIRNNIFVSDVIKDYPFMQEWWEKVNSTL